MENNLLHGAPLYYPSAKEWMWNYCIYLGPFTDSEGHNYDLGIHIREDKEPGSVLHASNASVYGNEPGNYLSGTLKEYGEWINEIHVEVVRRAKLLNLMSESKQPVIKQEMSGIMKNFAEDAIAEMSEDYYDDDEYPGL